MKRYMVICAPVTSSSGYGEHARDLVRAFLEHDKYDVEILDVPWGDCPRNALDVGESSFITKVSSDKEISKKIVKGINRQPDIYVDIRIPNEFQQIGKFNIGITAGVICLNS